MPTASTRRSDSVGGAVRGLVNTAAWGYRPGRRHPVRGRGRSDQQEDHGSGDSPLLWACHNGMKPPRLAGADPNRRRQGRHPACGRGRTGLNGDRRTSPRAQAAPTHTSPTRCTTTTPFSNSLLGRALRWRREPPRMADPVSRVRRLRGSVYVRGGGDAWVAEVSVRYEGLWQPGVQHPGFEGHDRASRSTSRSPGRHPSRGRGGEPGDICDRRWPCSPPASSGGAGRRVRGWGA